MVLVFKVRLLLLQIFGVVGDFMICLMRPLAHQILQHRIQEEHKMNCILWYMINLEKSVDLL